MIKINLLSWDFLVLSKITEQPSHKTQLGKQEDFVPTLHWAHCWHCQSKSRWTPFLWAPLLCYLIYDPGFDCNFFICNIFTLSDFTSNTEKFLLIFFRKLLCLPLWGKRKAHEARMDQKSWFTINLGFWIKVEMFIRFIGKFTCFQRSGKLTTYIFFVFGVVVF